MPKLVVRLAVSTAMAVVVMTGLQALRLRHPRAVAARLPQDSPASLVAAVPRLDFRAAVAAEPVVAPPRAPGESFGMARIYGHVVGPSGSLDDLEIAIEDAKRSYAPKLGEHGTFEINLPVGRYSITASSDDQVAVADLADLRADESREVVLVLSAGAAIAGRIEGCDGRCQVVTVGADVPTTGRRAGVVQSDAEGAFAVNGLVPGRAYDVVFEARGKRRLVMKAVPAPRQDLVVTLEPARSLAGGFGLEPGQDCPMTHVMLTSTGEDASTQMTTFDGDCRFGFADLPEAESVRLSADGEGWHFETNVALPAHGDPPFVCLHPTCREPRPQPQAQLTITPQDGSAVLGRIRIVYSGEARPIYRYCGHSAGECAIEDLRPGRGAHVTVQSRGCTDHDVTLDLHEGANFLGFSCEAVRAMQGVFSGAINESTLAGVRVRCSPDSPALPVQGRFFFLRCPARLTAIEYRTAEDGPWQSAAIVVDEGKPTGFVEITPG